MGDGAAEGVAGERVAGEWVACECIAGECMVYAVRGGNGIAGGTVAYWWRRWNPTWPRLPEATGGWQGRPGAQGAHVRCVVTCMCR